MHKRNKIVQVLTPLSDRAHTIAAAYAGAKKMRIGDAVNAIVEQFDIQKAMSDLFNAKGGKK